MKTLYLIDAYAQFFRAYHAIRTPMTSPVTKEPTNMTFGFVGMLLKLLRGEGKVGGTPDYVAIALDVGGDKGTFRSAFFPEYKANRPEPPEDLRPQVERALSILRALGVPIVASPGFEADDVIATIATTFSEQHPDVRVRIISKDKDLKQLLGAGIPPTEMYDIHTDELIDEAKLKEETGLAPSQVIDMLALMGDTVDNVPGVDGVGPKTAAQLIAEFGSLDAVIEEVKADKPAKEWKIKGKRREKILEAADRLPLSRLLVSLRHDAPIDFDLEKAKTTSFNLVALAPILKELGFNRYQDELKALLGGESEAGASPAPRAKASEPSGFGGLFDQELPSSLDDVKGEYTCVQTREALDAMLAKIEKAKLLSIDTETTNIRPMRADLCGLCLSVKPGKGWYVPVRCPEHERCLDEKTVLDALRPILEDASRAKVGHNLKYDLLVLRRAGVELRGFTPTDDKSEAGDTMIASYLIDASRSSHSLDALSLALLGRHNIPIKDLIGSGKSQKLFSDVPLEDATKYAAEDADATLQLMHEMAPELRRLKLTPLFRDLEMPLVEVLAELEWNGIRVDPDELDRQRDKLQTRIDELKQQISDAAYEACGRGFDPDSPKQLSSILFNKPEDAEPGLGIRPLKKTKTGYSTDAEVLEKIAQDPAVESEIPQLILEYRQLTKLVSTYLVALREEIHAEDGRIHASFNQTVAVTGRLSSSDPNLQNIPIRTEIGREIRRAFIAEEGHTLITADYSQIELRLLAHLSKDPALNEAFHQGEDIHTAVAAQIHAVKPEDVTREQRNGAKMVNFGIIYGVTPFGLARRLGISNTDAGEIIDGYKRRFAGITTFLQECVEQAHRLGYVETMMGRRRPIPDIDSNVPARRALAERTAINSVVQGSAADLIKIAMVDLHRRLSPHAANWRDGAPPEIDGVRMLVQIHDELVFEAPDAVADRARGLIVERMEAAMTLSVPLKVESAIGRSWFEGK
ncbi:MAG: DNA polymerase I [Phycisphaerales bacterium]